MLNVINSKNFKHNYYYYSPEVDCIFLVTISDNGNYILEWYDINGLPEMSSFNYCELEHDEFIGIELGEL